MKSKKNSKRKKQTEFSDTDYFDDCVLCQMMKEAEKKGKTLTESELKLGFKKMKEKSAIVEGEWFEDKKEELN